MLPACGAALFILYFFGLTRTGTLDPDEPRYASIGREMARSGDWITPRLWGDPWFEKPALLYWTTASAYALGLPDDWAPRIPVAILGAAFLVFFWRTLKREYDERAAWYASAMLGTSAGWLAYSHIAVTDLPLAACFGACMLLVMGGRHFAMAGGLLGLAVLAKGLVPYVLFLPAIWYLRRKPRQVGLILLVSVLVAAPWYAAATLKFGRPFLDEFFLKQHFARFVSGALQHVRPVWFYIPVLLGAIFPWTPVMVLLFRKSLYRDLPQRFLLAWLIFGFVFFSASENKLPGYLLPLLPPLAALLGLGLARENHARWPLTLTAALVWVIPAIARLLPQALASGVSKASFQFNYWLLFPMASFAVMVWWLRRDWGVGVIGLLMVAMVANVAWNTYPVLDRTVSPRAFWRSSAKSTTCADSENRAWRYGLNYYAGKIVPNCNH